jgi:hypothetical protein
MDEICYVYKCKRVKPCNGFNKSETYQFDKCLKCKDSENEGKPIKKFTIKGITCEDCKAIVIEQKKAKRRKPDRVCLRCKISQSLTVFDGTGRICLNCRECRSNHIKERNEYFNKFKEERRDYIYETNPSNYEDWEKRLQLYPWGYPRHLKDYDDYLRYHNKIELYKIKI